MTGETILIVDDNESNVELLREFLKDQDYKILIAYSGEEALDIIGKEPPDLILLDVVMPGLNGFEVCEIIKFKRGMHTLPIIMVTALNAKEDKLRGLEAGADDFISKPIDFAELTVRIRSLLRLKNTHDKLKETVSRLEYQLQLARSVQQCLVNTPKPQGLECEVFYKPMEEIGGDLYDFVKLDNNRYGIFIADCAGHGVPAALVMVMVKLIFTGIDKKMFTPGEVIKKINDDLARLNQGLNDLFCTAVYMEVDTENKKISWANAGHPNPILFRSEGGEILADNDTPMGILNEVSFRTNKIDFSEGDKLLLYTDGLPRVFAQDDDQFSEKFFPDLKEFISNFSARGNSIFCEKIQKKLQYNIFSDDVCYILVHL